MPLWRRKLPYSLLLILGTLPCMASDLMTIFTIALEGDPEYQAAGAVNRAAQEVRPQARAALLPNVGLDVTNTHTELEIREANFIAVGGGGGRPDFSSKRFRLALTQPIYRKALWIALRQAGGQIRQADADYAAARQGLMVRVAERYFGILRASDQLTFAGATLKAFGQQLKQSEQRFEVGLIAITDVEEAKAGFDLARADVIAAENQLATAREALREVTGEYPDGLAPLGEGMTLVTPDPADIDQWTATALEQNLRLAAARFASETAREEIKRVRAGHLPTLDLVGSHTRNDAGGGFSGGSNTWTTNLELQLNVPIYQGGRIMSRTRESRHLYRQTLDNLERERRRTQRETRDAFLGVQSGISRTKALEQAVRSSQAAAGAIDAGFQVGTRTSVDVLDAQRDLFLSKRDLADARYAYILDVLRLKRSAGTLTEQDLVQVNAWLE